jgi:NodT family efflux transporter outer membrane factor (OMF) lipoprotein
MRCKKFHLAIALLLAGCQVGPNYKKPDVPVEKSFAEMNTSTTQPSQMTARPIPITQWWASFRDPRLDSLIDRALQQNLDLQQAESRIRQARFQRGIIASGLFPNLDVTAGYQHARGSKNISLPLGGTSSSGGGSTAGGASMIERPAQASANSSGAPPGGPQSPLGLGGLPGVDTDLYQVGFDSTWELDLFGQTRRSIEAASADVAAAFEDHRAVLISLLGEVARTYIDLRGYQEQLVIAQRNLAAERDTLEIIEERRRAGIVSDLDVSQQTTQLSNTAAVIPQLQAQARVSIHALGILLGEDPDALASELDASQPLPPIPPEVPVGLPSDLLRRRPDVRRAERQLAAATARVGVATADLYPQFSITGQFGLDSSKSNQLAEWASRYYLVSPGVRWPIFDAGKIRGNIELQNELTHQAAIAYQQSILQALREVEDAIANYRQEQVRHVSLADSVTSSRDAVALATDQYRQGVVSFLTVLDAERSLYSSEDALAQSDRNIAADLVALYKALGGGWEVAANQS